MNVDILVRERDGDRGFYVPWLPEEIEYSSGGAVVASYDIMNRGPVEIPTASGLKELSWKGTFPGINRTDRSMLRDPTYRAPAFYHAMLEDWRKNGTVLNVSVYCYPINFDAILSEYTATAAGAFGDLDYTIRFKERRDMTLWLLKPTPVDTSASTTQDQAAEPKRAAATGATYTIKKGDSLWKIAAKQLGKGTRWTEIFELNKTVLEQEAQKHRTHCTLNYPVIYAGTVITLPAK